MTDTGISKGAKGHGERASESTLDVSHVPSHGFGHRMPLWWGTLAFVVIEGLGFVFAVAIYVYLQVHNAVWPPNPPPGLFWSGLLTGLFLLSEIPNQLTKRAAARHELRSVRIGLIVMSLIGVAALALRWFEFTTLGVSWNDNAYGSAVWLLMGLHTVHLITDIAETWVMTVLLFLGPVDVRRFSDVDDNQNYWDFVVLTWLGVYAVVYWLPRLAGGGG